MPGTITIVEHADGAQVVDRPSTAFYPLPAADEDGNRAGLVDIGDKITFGSELYGEAVYRVEVYTQDDYLLELEGYEEGPGPDPVVDEPVDLVADKPAPKRAAKKA